MMAFSVRGTRHSSSRNQHAFGRNSKFNHIVYVIFFFFQYAYIETDTNLRQLWYLPLSVGSWGLTGVIWGTSHWGYSNSFRVEGFLFGHYWTSSLSQHKSLAQLTGVRMNSLPAYRGWESSRCTTAPIGCHKKSRNTNIEWGNTLKKY